MLDSPDLKGRRTDTSSDDIWQQEKVLERFCNHAGDAVMTDQIDFSAINALVREAVKNVLADFVR